MLCTPQCSTLQKFTVRPLIDRSSYSGLFCPQHKLLNGDFRCQNLNKNWQGSLKYLIKWRSYMNVSLKVDYICVIFTDSVITFLRYWCTPKRTPLDQNPIIFSPSPKEDPSRCHMGSTIPPPPPLSRGLYQIPPAWWSSRQKRHQPWL